MPSKQPKSKTGSTRSIATPRTPPDPAVQTSPSPSEAPPSEPSTPQSPPPTRTYPVGGPSFPSVRKAREALKANAYENYEQLKKIIAMAAAAGDFETAAKYAWTLIEHTPKEDGESIIDESASKPKVVERGNGGPVIQIGVKVGGIGEPTKQLTEAVVIDVEPS